MRLPFGSLSPHQAKQVETRARKLTKSPLGPDVLKYLADGHLKHKAFDGSDKFRVSRTQLLLALDNQISRAALRKMLLGFESKRVVVLDGSYISGSQSFIEEITSSLHDPSTSAPKQKSAMGQTPDESAKTAREAPKPGPGTNNNVVKDPVQGTPEQNAPWDTEQQYALNCALEIFSTKWREPKDLLLFRLLGFCVAPPQILLAAVCGVASIQYLQNTVFPETADEGLLEIRLILAGKSSFAAANPRTFARIHQALKAAMADILKREEDRKLAAERDALRAAILSELIKRQEAQAQAAAVPPGAAPAGGAAPEAGNDPQLAETPQQPLFTSEGWKDYLKTVQPAAATEAVGPAQTGEPVPAARGTNPTIGAVADGAAALDTSETERLAAIYQLPQPGDWFKAA